MSKGEVALKPTGISWLGDVPAHWDVKKLRYVVNKIGSGKTPRGGAESYSSEGVIFIRSQNVYDDGLRLDDVVYIDDPTDEEMASTRVAQHDVLLNITGASIGRCARVPHGLGRANVNQHVSIVRPDRQQLDQDFLHAFLCSKATKEAILADEVGSSREALNFEQIASLVLPLPPLEEQRAIASYLNERTTRIDGLIARKEWLLALLKERRQSVITRAVTQGIDSTSKRKPSGVPWLGDVPWNWEVMPLKYAIGPMEQGWSPQCENYPAEEGEWGVLKAGCVNGTSLNESENKRLPDDLEPAINLEVKAGDILMSRANTTDLVGSCVYVEAVRRKLIVCDKLYRFHAIKDVTDGRFLVYFLRSRAGRSHMEQHASGASDSMQNIGQEVVRNTLIALPSIHEQKKIVSFLDRSTRRIDNLILNVGRVMQRLQEYRSALISEAVTGRIRVPVKHQSPVAR